MDDSFEGDEFSLAEREILMMKLRDHEEACLTLKAESDQAVKERDQMQAECNQMQAARDQAAAMTFSWSENVRYAVPRCSALECA